MTILSENLVTASKYKVVEPCDKVIDTLSQPCNNLATTLSQGRLQTLPQPCVLKVVDKL